MFGLGMQELVVLGLIVFVPLFLLLNGAILRWACGWCGVEKPGYGRAVGAVVARTVASFGAGAVIGLVFAGSVIQPPPDLNLRAEPPKISHWSASPAVTASVTTALIADDDFGIPGLDANMLWMQLLGSVVGLFATAGVYALMLDGVSFGKGFKIAIAESVIQFVLILAVVIGVIAVMAVMGVAPVPVPPFAG